MILINDDNNHQKDEDNDDAEPLGVEGDTSGELPEEGSSAHPETSASKSCNFL